MHIHRKFYSNIYEYLNLCINVYIFVLCEYKTIFLFIVIYINIFYTFHSFWQYYLLTMHRASKYKEIQNKNFYNINMENIKIRTLFFKEYNYLK